MSTLVTDGSAKSLSPEHRADEAIEFLNAVFDPNDTVLLRPVTTSTENGKKQTRVDHDGTQYLSTCLASLKFSVANIIARTETTKANLFFSVCPRFGSENFNLAWQVRIVRCLWADVDDGSIDEVLERCKAAKMPRPSIAIGSGHGIHAYWKLQDPFVIDDVENPRPVFKEFIERPNGAKKKVRQYYLHSNGGRVYLDIPRNAPALSAKALLAQDVLHGIAAAIGADHTFDLARLLRVPATKNRKGELNGSHPTECKTIFCEPDTRYPFEAFLSFAEKSPSKKVREKIARVPLPAVKKKISASCADRLGQLVTACDAATIGQRSDADWNLCCWAIEHGVAESEVWSLAESAGKFAERGYPYFQRTWEKAKWKTQEKRFAKAEKSVAKSASCAAAVAEHNDPESPVETLDPEVVGLTKALADTITDARGRHFARDSSGRLFVFRGGVYRPKGELVIRQLVKAILHAWEETKLWTPMLGDAVATYIAVDAPELWDRPPMDVINLANGLLRISDRTLSEHSPGHLTSVQLPVNYDAKASCPAIDNFIGQAFPADAHGLAYEIPAWLMTPMVSIQKAVLLLGPGGDGKSTYIALLLAFIGHANASNLSLHRLEADRFSAARLMGKLANACCDLPSEDLVSTSTFKAITGGDRMQGEHKFHDSFEFEPFARLIFSANFPPRSGDASPGFFRRWLPIPFDHTFDGTSDCIPREVLDRRLSDPSELSGLLNRALDALPGLKQRNDFTIPQSVVETLGEFRAVTDPVSIWFTENVIACSEMHVPCAELRDAYNRDAGEKGRHLMTAKLFGGAVRKFKSTVTVAQRTVNGRVQKCYLGLGLRHPDSPDQPDDPYLVSRGGKINGEKRQKSYYEAGM